MDCEICSIKDEVILESEYFKVILSYDQTYLGRCVIELKRHCGSLSKVTKEEWLDFTEVVKKLESALTKAFGATMFNWTCLMNNAYKNNPPNPHVHWHFRPRYNHEIKFAGLTFEDTEFGKHYSQKTKREVSEEVKKQIIKRIKENL